FSMHKFMGYKKLTSSVVWKTTFIHTFLITIFGIVLPPLIETTNNWNLYHGIEIMYMLINVNVNSIKRLVIV
ncbi:hypothetical protein ACJX0J_032547, partial [Zea mays]